MPRNQAQGIALRNRGQHQLRLQNRKGVAKVLIVVAIILLEHPLHLIGVIERIGRPEQEADHITIAVPHLQGKAGANPGVVVMGSDTGNALFSYF